MAIAFFWVALFLLSRLSPCGAFWVFGFPTLAGSFLLSKNPDPPFFQRPKGSDPNSVIAVLGNWSQHIFINPAHPRSNYHLTYNVINSDFNQVLRPRRLHPVRLPRIPSQTLYRSVISCSLACGSCPLRAARARVSQTRRRAARFLSANDAVSARGRSPASARGNNPASARGEQRTFNDGYHVEHHVHSKRHWTEVLPRPPPQRRASRVAQCRAARRRHASISAVPGARAARVPIIASPLPADVERGAAASDQLHGQRGQVRRGGRRRLPGAAMGSVRSSKKFTKQR